MKSSALGSSTSAVEVSHISSNELWLLAVTGPIAILILVEDGSESHGLSP